METSGSSKKQVVFNNRYLKMGKLGQGAFGTIYLVEDLEAEKQKSPKIIVLKTLKMDRNVGMDSGAIREVKILKEICHPNIITTFDFFMAPLPGMSSSQLAPYIAMEWLPLELFDDVIMNKKLVLDEGEIKYIALEIAKALGFLHGKWIMHRDVAPTNILLDLEANLKLTDFGLARYQAAPDKPMSINVITKYYRPPELFYGLKTYASSVDVWSFGCILAELYLRKPLFMGATEIEMLGKIFEVRGTPNYKTPTEQFNDWPGVQDLPWYLEINKSKPTPLEDIIPGASKQAIDVINLALQLNPVLRPSMEEVLLSDFFTSEPLPDKKSLSDKLAKAYQDKKLKVKFLPS